MSFHLQFSFSSFRWTLLFSWPHHQSVGRYFPFSFKRPTVDWWRLDSRAKRRIPDCEDDRRLRRRSLRISSWRASKSCPQQWIVSYSNRLWGHLQVRNRFLISFPFLHVGSYWWRADALDRRSAINNNKSPHERKEEIGSHHEDLIFFFLLLMAGRWPQALLGHQQTQEKE